jgi:hypothetical protein
MSTALLDAKETPRVESKEVPSGRVAGLAVTGCIVAMLLGGWYAPPGVNFAIITAFMLLVMAVLGLATSQNPLGALITHRNVMSLSRFQMALWTVLILGAYFTFALLRIKGGIQDPLDVQMDWHLWTLLGISTTALVGTPLILSTKQTKEPDQDSLQKAARSVGEDLEKLQTNREGTLYANASPSEARFSDLFQGDELINTAYLDLAKVQMFYFTVISAVVFFVMVFNAVVKSQQLDHLPILPDGLIAILGISNAGYLTSKGVGQMKTAT